MTRQAAPELTPVELAEIHSVYETLGLANASQRAQFTSFGQTQPTLLMSVTISTDSLPAKNG